MDLHSANTRVDPMQPLDDAFQKIAVVVATRQRAQENHVKRPAYAGLPNRFSGLLSIANNAGVAVDDNNSVDKNISSRDRRSIVSTLGEQSI